MRSSVPCRNAVTVDVALDRIDETCLEARKIVGFQIVRATVARVAAGQVDTPEIILCKRQLAEYVLHRFANEAGDTARVLGLDKSTLRMWHAEQVHDELARDRPVDGLVPQGWRDAFIVDATLLVEVTRIEQFERRSAQSRLGAEPGSRCARDEPGQSVEIEAAGSAREPVRTRIPPLLGERAQALAQALAVQRIEAGVPATAEDREEIVEVERPDARDLELEQRVLAWIRIDAMNAARAAQRVVERVAARACYHEHGIVGT